MNAPTPQRCLVRILLFLYILLATCHSQAADQYRVVHTYPHDPTAFTQGLIYLNGLLYESTGLNGRSSLRAADLKTGAVLQRSNLPEQYFGEGLTNWQNTLVQITWKSHVAFVYDRFSFRLLRTFQFDGEGWGLTQDGHNLILSDGTAFLKFLDPNTFHVVRHIRVTDKGAPLDNLNELEYLHGMIYANIWHTNRIVRISPQTGAVLGTLDLSGLLFPGETSDPEAVLNGIAYDASNDHLFVTGKLWPKLFEIQLKPEGRPATARK